MKKLLLLSSLVIPFLLGGCNNKKIDGPVNNYYQHFTFKRSAEDYYYNISYDYNSGMPHVSSINEVEETYNYSEGVEELTSIKANTKFFTDAYIGENPHSYVAETNKEYLYKKNEIEKKRESKEEYTSNLVKWNNTGNYLFSIETIKQDDTEETKYDVVAKDAEDAWSELFLKPSGDTYIDRQNRLNYYIDRVETYVSEDMAEPTYKYVHKEQCLYLMDGSGGNLSKYHYYDEVVSTKDPVTGKFFDRERIISYRYHTIEYQYKAKEKRDVQELNYKFDGHSKIVSFGATQHECAYHIENGGYYVLERDAIFHDNMRYSLNISDSGNKYTYTFSTDLYDTHFYDNSKKYAFRFETELVRLSGTSAIMTYGGKITFDGYHELLNSYYVYAVDGQDGQYLIYEGNESRRPRITFIYTFETGKATSVNLDIKVAYANLDG